MKELAFCFCVVIGFAGGAWAGSELATKSARDVIGKECRCAGAFTIRKTGFECWPVKK